jgi:DNA-binding response OmpR family regulator
MKALIVEDDAVLADVMSFTLRRAGFEVAHAPDGTTGRDMWQSEDPAIIILDVELPGVDGFTLCGEIRSCSSVPIIMVTVRDSDSEIVRGLELGADDYITKPFSPAQFVARVQAVMRRANDRMVVPQQISAGKFRLDGHFRRLDIQGYESVTLTALESRLMEALMINAGQVLTINALISYIWNPFGGDRAMLKQLVYRLRRKIEPEGANPPYIQTIPGVGYTLVNYE